ncbi:20278_t:CDS:2 [Cetraspora pellucida]|uniref:20278_t:CDS:1 n=1 Tax=Cetraspora pellucida TaxID=1433469 RepID=A0A9N8VES6_9GLOM|nr:20278_t:CDS:2 [Cetraspora pellucida]
MHDTLHDSKAHYSKESNTDTEQVEIDNELIESDESFESNNNKIEIIEKGITYYFLLR